jgi:hypothetical protein
MSSLDLEDIAAALADQTDYGHRWLINPKTGEIVFWTSDTGIDGQTAVDLNEVDLLCIDPLPPYIWYQDMADFGAQLSDERAGQRLARALQGTGAFRRFKAARSSGSPITRSSPMPLRALSRRAPGAQRAVTLDR